MGAAGREEAPAGLGDDEHVAELAEAGLVRPLAARVSNKEHN